MKLYKLHSPLTEEIMFIGGDDVDQSIIDAGYKLFADAGLRAAGAEELYAVAMDGDEVTGAMTATVIDNKLTFSVVTSDKHRRQGIGKSLIDAAIADAKSMGLSEVNANVVNPNLLKYLKSIGFEHEVIGGQDWAFLNLD